MFPTWLMIPAALGFVCLAWNCWIFETEIRPVLRERGVIQRFMWIGPTLLSQIESYRHICMSEKRSFKALNQWWLSYSLGILSWGSVVLWIMFDISGPR